MNYSSNLVLDESVSILENVGLATTKALNQLNIYTLRDLLSYYPVKYLDCSKVSTITQAQPGNTYTIVAEVCDINNKQQNGTFDLIELALVDHTSNMIVSLFNYSWILNHIHSGDKVAVCGKLEFNYGFKRMTNPTIHIVYSCEDAYQFANIMPIYSATKKISSYRIAKIIRSALEMCANLNDFMPKKLIESYNLLTYKDALNKIHCPSSSLDIRLSRRSLKYYQVFLQQTYLSKRFYKATINKKSYSHIIDGRYLSLLFRDKTNIQKDLFNLICQFFVDVNNDTNMLNLVCDPVKEKSIFLIQILAAIVADSNYKILLISSDIYDNITYYQKISHVLSCNGIKCGYVASEYNTDIKCDTIRDFNADKITFLFTHKNNIHQIDPTNVSTILIEDCQDFNDKDINMIFSRCFDKNRYVPKICLLTSCAMCQTYVKLAWGFANMFKLNYCYPKLDIVLGHRNNQEAYNNTIFSCLEQNKQCLIFCPLVGNDVAARNKKTVTYEFISDTNITYEEVKYDIVNIEQYSDCNDAKLDSIKTYVHNLKSNAFNAYELDVFHNKLDNVQKDTIIKNFNMNNIDVLVTNTIPSMDLDCTNVGALIVEDADRFSLDFLFQLRAILKKPHSKMYISYNSKRENVHKRLLYFKNSSNPYEALKYDAESRCSGDILGNRKKHLKRLNLINLIYDKSIINCAHDDSKKILKDNIDLSSQDCIGLKYELYKQYEA